MVFPQNSRCDKIKDRSVHFRNAFSHSMLAEKYLYVCELPLWAQRQSVQGHPPKSRHFNILFFYTGAVLKLVSLNQVSVRQCGTKQNWIPCYRICAPIKLCLCVCLLCPQMLMEVVTKTLKHHGITGEHKCFEACSKRLFDISKFYLKVGFVFFLFVCFVFAAHTQWALSSLWLPLCLCSPVHPGELLQVHPYVVCLFKILWTNWLDHSNGLKT